MSNVRVIGDEFEKSHATVFALTMQYWLLSGNRINNSVHGQRQLSLMVTGHVTLKYLLSSELVYVNS